MEQQAVEKSYQTETYRSTGPELAHVWMIGRENWLDRRESLPDVIRGIVNQNSDPSYRIHLGAYLFTHQATFPTGSALAKQAGFPRVWRTPPENRATIYRLFDVLYEYPSERGLPFNQVFHDLDVPTAYKGSSLTVPDLPPVSDMAINRRPPFRVRKTS